MSGLSDEQKVTNTLLFENMLRDLNDGGTWKHKDKNYSMKKMGDKFVADVETYLFLQKIVLEQWLGSRVIVETVSATSNSFLTSMFPDTRRFQHFYDSRHHILLEKLVEKLDNDVLSYPTARKKIDDYCERSSEHKEFFLFHKSKTEPVFGKWNYDKTS